MLKIFMTGIFEQVSPCMERAVLKQLSDYFKSRLARYPTSLSEDEALVIIFTSIPCIVLS